jgi:hypothetical protein
MSEENAGTCGEGLDWSEAWRPGKIVSLNRTCLDEFLWT